MDLAEALWGWTEESRERILSKATLPLIDSGEIDMSQQISTAWDSSTAQIRESGVST